LEYWIIGLLDYWIIGLLEIHSTIPSFHHTSFHHSIPPFHHSTIPSFHHSIIPSKIQPFSPQAQSQGGKYSIGYPPKDSKTASNE
jgi:hypothetical protein